jgi:hypothetical protein
MLLSSTIEPRLRLLTGFVLWGISSVLTCSLLLSLANGNTLQGILLILIALALEGAKILSWRKQGKARFFSFALIALSAFASFGAALQTVEGAKASFLSSSLNEIKQTSSYTSLCLELKSIDSEIGIDIERLRKLPPDFISAARNLSSSLQGLRERRATLTSALSTMEATQGEEVLNSNMFVLIGKTIGMKPEIVLLILLLFLSGSIEAGALILTSPNKPIERLSKGEAGKLTLDEDGTACMPPMKPYIEPEQFLEAAKTASSDLPYLLGQNRTSKLLGISPSQGRRLVRELLRNRKIEVFGKRLRLVQVESGFQPCPSSTTMGQSGGNLAPSTTLGSPLRDMQG